MSELQNSQKSEKRAKRTDKFEAAALFPPIHVNNATCRVSGPRAPPRNKMALYESITMQSRIPRSYTVGVTNSGSAGATSAISAPEGSSLNGGLAQTSTTYNNQYSYLPYGAQQQQLPGQGISGTGTGISTVSNVHYSGTDSFDSSSHCADYTPPLATSLGMCRMPAGVTSGSNTTAVSPAIGRSRGGPQPATQKTMNQVGRSIRLLSSQNCSETTGQTSDVCDMEHCSSGSLQGNHRQQAGSSMLGGGHISEPGLEIAVPDDGRCRGRLEVATAPIDRGHHWQENKQTDLGRELRNVSDDLSLPSQQWRRRLAAPNLNGAGPSKCSSGTNLNDSDDSTHCEEDKSYTSNFGRKGKEGSVERPNSKPGGQLSVMPMDVVAVIGQQEFWRARKAILRQQRILTSQVFNLHRLIKVQADLALGPLRRPEENTFKEAKKCELSIKLYSSDCDKAVSQGLIPTTPLTRSVPLPVEPPVVSTQCEAAAGMGCQLSSSSAFHSQLPLPDRPSSPPTDAVVAATWARHWNGSEGCRPVSSSREMQGTSDLTRLDVLGPQKRRRSGKGGLTVFSTEQELRVGEDMAGYEQHLRDGLPWSKQHKTPEVMAASAEAQHGMDGGARGGELQLFPTRPVSCSARDASAGVREANDICPSRRSKVAVTKAGPRAAAASHGYTARVLMSAQEEEEL